MKRVVFYIVLAISVSGCAVKNDKFVEKNDREYKFSTVSAEKALKIAESISTGSNVPEMEWSSLFSSEGFENYLIHSDSIEKKRLIRYALQTAFDPTHKSRLDSLLNIPLTMNQDYLKLSLIHNFTDLQNNFDKAKKFLQTTDFNLLIASGDSLARSYLPKRVQDSLPQLYDIYMIVSDPDAKVMENAIVFDLNMASTQGKDDLVKIIAHEFHHNYRTLTAKDYKHPLTIQLNKIHQEGVADLIDKDKPPIQKLNLYPQAIIDLYNSDYINTPEKLKNLDSLTNAFLRQEIDSTTFHNQLNNYFGFGGHTAGIYMSLKILQKKKINVLIETFDDPIAFIRIYNEVVQGSSTDHVFSPEFMQYLEQFD